MREEPVQSYYPSCRLRVVIRFEDFGAKDTPETPELLPQQRGGKKAKSVKKLEVRERDGGLVLVGPGDDPTAVGTPQQQHGSTDGRTHVIDGIIPRVASIGRNGVRTANTLTVEVAYRDLPFDLRVIRAAAVECFLGTVPAEDYQRGVDGEMRSAGSTLSGVELPYNVIPDTYYDVDGRLRSNLRFEGWVDLWEDDWSDGSMPRVKLTCTDNTRLLIEQEAPSQLSIGVDKPIHRAMAEYLSNFPQFRGLGVRYFPLTTPEEKIPVLKKALLKTAYQPKLGPTPSGSNGGTKLKVWDYLTDVAMSVGHIIRVVGSDIVVQRPRTLYDDRLSGRPEDPFKGRILPSGLSLTRRLWVYGRNVRDMSGARKFTSTPGTCVECRAYDTSKKTTLVARFPLKADRPKRLLPGNAADQKWKVVVIDGIRDVALLRLIAQAHYEQLNRNEIGFKISTKNLGSFGGGNLDPDALDLEEGDAVDVKILPDEEFGNTIEELEQAKGTRAADLIRSLGFSDEVAQAYQEAVNNVGMPSTFRVRTVAFDWDVEEGVSISLELVNYLTIRSDAQLPADEEITVADSFGDDASRVVVSDDVGQI